MRPIQENDVFHAIAHPARRAILVKLRDGERTASDLAEPFDMTFAAISQHLRVLEEAELVVVRRETGSWRHAAVMALYMFALAYLAAFVVYRVAVAMA